MTSDCKNCNDGWVEIVASSYGDGHVFEAYECEFCGATGSLSHDPVLGTTLSGCLR